MGMTSPVGREVGTQPSLTPPSLVAVLQEGSAARRATAASVGAGQAEACHRRAVASVERDHAADAVLRVHQLEAAVDLVEGDPVGEQRLDVDLAGEPAVDEQRHLACAP